SYDWSYQAEEEPANFVLMAFLALSSSSDTEPVSITAVIIGSADVPKIMVTRPRLAHPIVTKSKSPIRRYITRSQSPKTSNSPPRVTVVQALVGNPQYALKYNGVIDSGCLRHITRNMSYLSDFEELNGGYVALEELKFNLFSISQMCDKKNHVLFIDTECLVLSHDFKLPDESQVLLRVPRENNMYNVNLKNIVPSRDLTRLFAKATIDETSLILKTFITGLENQLSLMVKVIRSDNGTEFKNSDLNQFCKFDGKADEGYLVGYSVSSKAFRVFNSRNQIVQETLHINFLENKPNVAGSGPTWLFDIDTLSKTMNYQPVTAGNQSNPSAGIQEQFDVEKAGEESAQQYVLFPVWSSSSINPQNTNDDAAFGDFSDDNINEVNAADSQVPAVGQILTNNTNTFSAAGPLNAAVSPTHRKSSYVNTSQYPDDPNMPELEYITYFDDEEDVWVLVDLPHGKRAIGTKWVFRNKKDERCSVVRNKARLVAQGHTQEEGIKYKEVFSPVTRIEAIRLFLAYASFMGFMVYQMDVKSAFIDLCKAFEKLMKDKFQMSSMGELAFFLVLQVKQKPDGIFISQDKYVAEILRKFG
nr:hypothetical protein [Tanacetum cinerariifolium]